MVDGHFSQIYLSQDNCNFETNIVAPITIGEIYTCSGEESLQSHCLRLSKDGLDCEIWLLPWSIVGENEKGKIKTSFCCLNSLNSHTKTRTITSTVRYGADFQIIPFNSYYLWSEKSVHYEDDRLC